MPIRITGLNSGLDTESIISALVSSYNYKTNKYKKAQTKLSWKQDAWKSLNTKIYSLYNSVGNLRYSSAYSLKSTNVSDSTKVTVSAGSSAANGSYSIQVTSLAKSGYLTGKQLDKGTTAGTKLSDLDYKGGDGKMSLTVDGKTTDISVTGDTTIQQVVNQLKDAGVNASYDETNRRLFISAKSTGVKSDFSLSASNEDGWNALTKLGINVESTANTEEYKALAAYADMSEDKLKAIIQEKLDAQSKNKEVTASNKNYENAIIYANAVKGIRGVAEKGNTIPNYELLRDLAGLSSLSNKYVDKDGNIYSYDKETKKYSTVKTASDGSSEKVEVEESEIKAENSGYVKAEDKYNELAKSFGLITTKTDENGKEVEDKTALTKFKNDLSTVGRIDALAGEDSSKLRELLDAIESDGNDVDELIKQYNDNIAANKAIIAVNNQILAANEKLSLEAMTKPNENGEVIVDGDAVEAFVKKASYAKTIFEKIEKEKKENSGKLYSPGATRVNGSDATIHVNGAEYTGTSNTFSINGMTFTATGVTGSEYDKTESSAVNVTVNTDVQGIYDKVKDFLTQYNSIINEMTSLYNADSAKGYEPLTDEEKDAMSDTEVQKWEEKIKASLLRRDNTLSSIISSMTNAMSQGVEVNGKKYYFSNFGINTLGYLNAATNEHYAYHIDGDEDDVNTSGNTDKLMAAIAEDPDTVLEFMKGMANNLYDAVDKKMKSTTLSSSYMVYNDKEMASEYSDYTSLITKWQERLESQEEYYYNKFSAMETALAKLNSQSSSLSGLFG